MTQLKRPHIIITSDSPQRLNQFSRKTRDKSHDTVPLTPRYKYVSTFQTSFLRRKSKHKDINTHLFSLCGQINWYHLGESVSSVWASLLWASLLVGEFTGYHLYTTYLPLAIKQRTISWKYNRPSGNRFKQQFVRNMPWWKLLTNDRSVIIFLKRNFSRVFIDLVITSHISLETVYLCYIALFWLSAALVSSCLLT